MIYNLFLILEMKNSIFIIIVQQLIHTHSTQLGSYKLLLF